MLDYFFSYIVLVIAIVMMASVQFLLLSKFFTHSTPPLTQESKINYIKRKDKHMKKAKGITLVALVITIIILLILAGISISVLTNTEIIQKAKEAK